MFIISEYVACVFAVWMGMTLLFMACVVFLAIEEGCTVVARKLPDFTSSDIPLIGRWAAAESRKA